MDVIKFYIQKVVGYWKGCCYVWDVVNEVFEEDGLWCEFVFYKVFGEDYIKIVFVEVVKVDFEVKFYYNDYNFERFSVKSCVVVDIVRMFQDDGIKIDGVGMQVYIIVGCFFSIDGYIVVIDMYVEIGVEVVFIEFDICIVLFLNEINFEWQKQDYCVVSIIQLIFGYYFGFIVNKIYRLLVVVFSFLFVLVLFFGIFMIFLVGFFMFLRVRVLFFFGLMILLCILFIMVFLLF